MIVRNRSWPAVSLQMRRRRGISDTGSENKGKVPRMDAQLSHRSSLIHRAAMGSTPDYPYYSYKKTGGSDVMGTHQCLPAGDMEKLLSSIPLLPGDSPQSFWVTEEPRLVITVCKYLGLHVWKGLVMWHGDTAIAGGLSCWVTPTETQGALSYHLGGGQRESPSLLAWR